jgi:hypothetical protein
MPDKCKQCTLTELGLVEAGGVWISAYHDLSGVEVFATELDALRAANGTGAVALFVKFGSSIVEAVRNAP